MEKNEFFLFYDDTSKASSKMMNFDSCMRRMNTMSAIFNRKFPCQRVQWIKYLQLIYEAFRNVKTKTNKEEIFKCQNEKCFGFKIVKKIKVFEKGKVKFSVEKSLRMFHLKSFSDNETKTH